VAQVTPERQLKDGIVRLRRDIEQVREELGETLAALEDRASPKRIAERNKARARERIDAARRSATGVLHSVDKRVLIGATALLAALMVVRLVRR
jgi:hypothetical protein